MTSPPQQNWTTEDSARLYRVRDWGAGYFDVNDKGDVTVGVEFDSGRQQISLMDVVAGIR